MREKTIFNGLVDAGSEDIWATVDAFLIKNSISPLDSNPDFKIDTEVIGAKRVLVIYPAPKDNVQKDKIINGYIEANPVSLFDDRPVELRIVSCRPELDFLYFQLSQLIQARSIVPDFPADILVTPWRKLLEEGIINPNKTNIQDLADDTPDPDDTVKKYGTYRNKTKNDVRRMVRMCRHHMRKGGTIKDYYDEHGVDQVCSFETFRSWVKNPDFREKIP